MARKLEYTIINGKKMAGYSAQIGIGFKYSLCEACMKKSRDTGTQCGILNTITEIGKDMGFYAPVFNCEHFEKGLV